MKWYIAILIGIGVFILGLYVSSFIAEIFLSDADSGSGMAAGGILYTASVISVCTYVCIHGSRHKK